jgi:hypothetical protein
MSIDHKDIKILWGRAAGICSEPNCTLDLTILVENDSYSIGEMAHIIGSKPDGPRGIPEGGSDRYGNLILLCPTHHRLIDKAPEGKYPPDLLHEWKEQHEAMCRNVGKDLKYGTFRELSSEVSKLLFANRAIFEAYGPLSETARDDPGSNLFLLWELKRSSEIVPNNTKILNILDANESLIEPDIWQLVELFRTHANAYRKHCEHRLDSYPLFPDSFEKAFSNV